MSERSSTSSYSNCSGLSTDSELDNKNGYEFVYSMFKAQGDDEAYNRLTPAIPRNQFGVVDPNDALEVIANFEKNRISDLFKVLVSPCYQRTS